MKRKKAYIAIIVLAIVFASGSFLNIKADTVTRDLSKDEAVAIARENNLQYLKVNTAINTITRKISDYKELSQQSEELEKSFQQYQAAYSGLTSQQKYLFNIYNQTEEPDRTNNITAVLKLNGSNDAQISGTLQQLGKLNYAGLQLKKAKLVDNNLEPKELTAEQKYNTFAYPQQIPVILVQNKYKKASLQLKVIKSAVDVKVKQAYDTILYAEDGYSLTTQLYEKQVKDFNDTQLKYQAGVISELDRDQAGMELQQSKLKLDNLGRQLANGKLQFNQALGSDMNTEYNLIDGEITAGNPGSYNSYVERAMDNRAEIIAADIDIQEKQTIFDLVKQYFSHGDLQYEQAFQELEGAKAARDEASKKIENEIQSSYLDLKQKQSAKLLADAKLQQAKSQYNSVQAGYDAGVMPISMLWNVELAVNQAEMNKSKAARDYKNALYQLEQNCSTGTEYVMEGEN